MNTTGSADFSVDVVGYVHSRADNSWTILAADGHRYTPDDFLAVPRENHDRPERR